MVRSISATAYLVDCCSALTVQGAFTYFIRQVRRARAQRLFTVGTVDPESSVSEVVV